MIGAMLCGLGFICALVVSFLDKMGVRALGDEDNLKMQSKKLVGQTRAFNKGRQEAINSCLISSIIIFHFKITQLFEKQTVCNNCESPLKMVKFNSSLLND